ncbi:MAG TPA: hypothetical protein VFW94_24355 [Candidatus Acidoferrales bacterium]|nr:hypothetical protein [Candidatus Acidoferrales bacterium]
MAFFDTLKKWEHSFTTWAATEWSKIYNEAPKVEHAADTALKYAIPAAGIIVQALGNAPEAQKAVGILTEAQRDMQAASGLIYDFGANPSAGSILSGVQSNLASLLEDAHVKNTNTTGKITNIINAIAPIAEALAPAAIAAVAGA